MFLKLFIIAILITFCATEDECNLQRVFVIFRHGIRAPLSRFSFDPYYSDTYWPQGGSQLTGKGKTEIYGVGKKLRARYQNYIEPHSQVLADDIQIVATKLDRVLQTAGILLSSFYPPSEDQVFTDELKWSPIPTYTTSPDKSPLVTDTSGCDKYYQERNKDYDALNSDPLFNETYQYLKQYDTKGETKKPTDMINFYDSISSSGRMNYTLPDWVAKIYPDTIHKLISKAYLAYTGGRDSVKRLFAGPLAKDIISKINETISSKTSKSKFYMYAGHDTSIFGLLNLLGIKLEIPPDFVSTLILELYKSADNKYFIKLIYSRTINFEQEVLKIPSCGEEYCPYETFLAIAKPYLPNNWENECKITTTKTKAKSSRKG